MLLHWPFLPEELDEEPKSNRLHVLTPLRLLQSPIVAMFSHTHCFLGLICSAVVQLIAYAKSRES